MNFAAPMQYGMAGGAATMLAATSAKTAPDPFDKSPLNPINMSRKAVSATGNATGSGSASNAPSSKLLERVRVSAADLAELACVQAGWRYVQEKNNTAVYEMNGSVLPSTVSVASTFGAKVGTKASDYYLVKGVTTVRATDADRVLALLAADDSETFALRMNQIFGRQYQHGVVIDHMSCTAPPERFQTDDGAVLQFTDDDAYAVNWLALKPTGENARDFTFASYQDTFQRDARGALVRLGRRAARDAAMTATPHPLASSSASVSSATSGSSRNGRLLGVHVLSSFNFKDIPELPRHKNTDRLHLRTSGFVVEETPERGVLRLSLFLSLTPVAATLRSPKKYEKWLQSLALGVGNVALQLVKNPAHPATPPSQVTTPDAVKVHWKKSDHCALCLKSFHTFRRCHHCRFCGEAVCNKCSGFVDVSKVNVVEALQGRVRAGAALPHSELYAETRGCSRCIQTLMDDLANAYTSSSVCETPDESHRVSGTTSHSSIDGGAMRNSRLAGSFLAQHPQHPPSPFVVHHYEDDDLSSLDSTSTDGRGYTMQSTGSVPMVPNARQRSDDALTMDDLDGYTWSGGVRAPPHPALSSSAMRFAKPPLDPKSSLSMSTVSTSHSYDEQNLRVSAASQETYGSHHSHHHSINNQLDHHQPQHASPMKQLMMHPHVRSPEEERFAPHASAMAIAGLSLHDDDDHLDLHDHDADADDAVSHFARSMVSLKSVATAPSSGNNAVPVSRLTTSSTSSGGSGASFKFSMMSSHLSLHSEPEMEPNGDSFSGHFYSRSSDHQRSHQSTGLTGTNGTGSSPNVPVAAPPSVVSSSSAASSSKLFSMSAGPRFHAQQHQSRPPRPQPSQLHMDRARSSSSSSSGTRSVASLRAHEDMMIPLPPAAMAALGSGGGGGAATVQNDMILLTPAAPKAPQFVEFSSAHRESICMRPGDGSDMIPLRF